MTATTSAPRVLVVDDNRDAADSAAELLRLAGFEVRVSYGGPDALRAAAEFHPRVGVLDLNMPGMDGDELAGRLRAEALAAGEPPPALVALTARSDAAGRGRTTAAGFARHLVKPADPAELLAAVAAAATEPGVTVGRLTELLAGLPPDAPVRFGPPGLLTFDRVVRQGGAAVILFKEVAGVEYAPLPAHRRAGG